ncbi:hypothetical protein [Streptomyces luteogriseus]|uniref:hypothetical protein n=1 Tax=Streptomyces luteogriseus TaxID=68233 RepID=UPI0037FADE72
MSTVRKHRDEVVRRRGSDKAVAALVIAVFGLLADVLIDIAFNIEMDVQLDLLEQLVAIEDQLTPGQLKQAASMVRVTEPSPQ